MTAPGLAEIALLRSPFRGLSPFGDSELDALLFFGREREAEVIAANLMAAKLTLLYGPSGVGKTSVLRAGMAQRLRSLARENARDRGAPELAVAIVDAWSGDSTAAVVEAATQAVADVLDGAVVDLGEGTLVERLGVAADLVGGDLYLVLDQFEEFFLYHAEEAGEDTLTDAFPELVVRTDAGVNLLVCIREDALAHLDVFKAKVPGLFANSLRLDRLDRRAARDAIVGPLEAYNRLVSADERVEIEPALVEAVLDQVTVGRIDHGRAGKGTARGRVDRSRIEAPYLQLVLLRVWDTEQAEGSRELRLDTLERLGGAQRIVEQHLEGALGGLSDDEREAAARVFRHLVTPSGTKIAHRTSDLAGYAGLPEQDVQSVLGVLAAQRIVRPLGGDAPGDDRYEIYHDVLTDAVLAWRTRYEAGRQLEQERREASRRQRRLTAVAAVSLIALVAMAAMTVFAFQQREEAQDQRAQARKGTVRARFAADQAEVRELVARASAELETSPLTSLELAALAARRETNEQVEDVLRRAISADRQRAVISASSPVASAAFLGRAPVAVGDEEGQVQLARRTGDVLRTIDAGSPVRAIAPLPRGRFAVAAGNSVLVFREDGTRTRRLPHPRPVVALSTTPAGVTATGTADGVVRVWRTAASPVVMAPALGSALREVSVSPDGSKVVTVWANYRAAVYDAFSGKLLFRPDRAGQVGTAAWSPTGRRLATAGPGETVHVWRTASWAPWHEFEGHVGPIVDLAFSANGIFLVSASTDGTARTWNVPEKLPVAVLVGHSNPLVSAAFSPDGLLVVTASSDRTARIWRSDTGNRLTVFVGHRDAVAGAEFSPDGRAVLTWSADGTARLWDPETQPKARVIGRIGRDGVRGAIAPDSGVAAVLTEAGAVREWSPGRRVRVLRQPGGSSAVALARDGSILATGGRRGVAYVYGARPGPPLRLRHGSPISALALDEQGRLAVTAGRNGTSTLWRLPDGERVRPLERVRGPIDGAALSRDGRLVALGNRRGDGFLLDAATGAVEAPLRGHRRAILSLAFSPDGRRLATVGVHRDGRLWDVPSGTAGPILVAHYAKINGVAYSPDGRWIITAGPGTAGIWAARSGAFQGYVRGHRRELLAAGFTADGGRIRTIGIDGTVREQACPLCGGVPELRALAEARLSRAARQDR